MQKKFSQTSGYEIDRELHKFARNRQSKEQSPQDVKVFSDFLNGGGDSHHNQKDPSNLEKFNDFKSRLATEIVEKLGVTQHLLDPIDWFLYREAPNQIRRFMKPWCIHVGNQIHVYRIVRVYQVPPTLPNITSKIQTAARPGEKGEKEEKEGLLFTESGFAIPQLHKTQTHPSIQSTQSAQQQQKMFLRPNDARISNTAYDLQFLVDIVRFVYVPKQAETFPPAPVAVSAAALKAEIAALKKKKTVPLNWQKNWMLVKKQLVGLRQPWHKFACPTMSFIDKRTHGTLHPDYWIYEEPSDQGGYLQCHNTAVTMPQNETLTHNTIHTFPVTKHRSKSETMQGGGGGGGGGSGGGGGGGGSSGGGNQETLDEQSLTWEERARKVQIASKRPQSVHLEIRCTHPTLRCKSTSTIKHVLSGAKSPFAQNLQNFVVRMQFLDEFVSPTVIFFALGETNLANIPKWVEYAADPLHWYPETFVPILEKMLARHPLHIKTQEDAWIAISDVAGRNLKEASREKKLAHAQKIIQEDIYPNVGLNMNCNAQKILLHSHIIWRQLMASLNFVFFDDKDTYSRQRYDTNAQMFSTLIRNILGVLQSMGERNLLNMTIHHSVQLHKDNKEGKHKKEILPAVRNGMQHQPQWQEKDGWQLPYFNWSLILNQAKINEKIASVICRGTPWSISPKPGAARQSVTVAIGFRNWFSSQGSRARQNNTANKQQRRNNSARQLEATQGGYVCADQTPEGTSFGISRFQAQGSSIATTSSRSVVVSLLMHALEENRDYKKITFDNFKSFQRHTQQEKSKWPDRLMVDGKFEWDLADGKVILKKLESWRRIGLISPHISIYLQDRILYVNVAPGQAVRALLSLESITPFLKHILSEEEETKIKHPSPLFTLESKLGYQPVEWIRPDELRSLSIETDPHHWIYRKEVFGDCFSHMEIEPSWLHGITAGCLPFSHHNQATRAVIGSNMLNQAFSANINSLRMYQQQHILKSPQYPLVETRALRDLDAREAAANGQNVTMCVTTRAFGEEDTKIFNADSLAFGMLNSEIHKQYMTTAKPNLFLSFVLASQSSNTKVGKSLNNMFQHISHRRESFEVPDDRCLGKHDANYSKLEADGLPKIGTILQAGDVIIGKVSYEVARNDPKIVYKKDESILMKDPIGIVIEVTSTQFASYCITKKVTIQIPCPVELGNKFSLRGGQKGTAGEIIRGRNALISLATGRYADMIMNPIGYIARQTFGIVKEQHRAQAAALMAKYMDGTCYNRERMDQDRKIAEFLYACGVDKICYEPHLNGETGEITEPLLTAQVYVSALIHLVSFKMHARAIGPVTLATRQAVEGRVNLGGLRWGAMEIDAACANGMAFFNSDRNGSYDQFTVPICGTCAEEPVYCAEAGYRFCKACKTGDNVKITQLSFIDNVVFRKELPGIGVRASFITKEMGDPWADKAHLKTWEEFARSVCKESDTQLLPQPDPWTWKKFKFPEPETIGGKLDQMSRQNDLDEKESLLWHERQYHQLMKEQKQKKKTPSVFSSSTGGARRSILKKKK